MTELSMHHELQRLKHIRKHLDQQSQRLMQAYSWLRQQGVLLHQKLSQPTTMVEPHWTHLSQQYLQLYQRLEQENQQFQAACTQYAQDAQRLQQTLDTHIPYHDAWELVA